MINYIGGHTFTLWTQYPFGVFFQVLIDEANEIIITHSPNHIILALLCQASFFTANNIINQMNIESAHPISPKNRHAMLTMAVPYKTVSYHHMLISFSSLSSWKIGVCILLHLYLDQTHSFDRHLMHAPKRMQPLHLRLRFAPSM